jgi:threonine/homoserine/homoserine lactone efflux protein
MIDLNVFFQVLLLFTLALISPGPDFLTVTTISLTRGHKAGVKTSAEIALINCVYSLFALMSVSALLEQHFWLSVTIKICGGIYLLYLGISLWRAAKTTLDQNTQEFHPGKSAFLTGVFLYPLTH